MKRIDIEYAQNGGKASAQSKKNKKMLSEYLSIAMSSPIKDEKVLSTVVNNFNFKEDDLNYNSSVVVALIQAAMKGNVEAIKLIREMTSDKPIQSEKIKKRIAIPAELIGKAFTELNFYINQKKYRDYYLRRW